MKKGKVLGGLAAACISTLMMLLFLIPTAFADTDTDAIPDTGTHAALYEAIVAAKPGIDANHDSILQASELDTITGPLDLSNKGITDISGIQYCGNLVTLSLSNVNSTTPNDITAMPQDLSGMTSLNDLDLFNNPNLHSCPNLSALSTIPNVRNINLLNTGITDFGFLAPESSPSPLVWLCIDDNNLTTAGLHTLADNASKFPNLKDLYFSRNGSLGDGAVSIVASAFPHLEMLAMGKCGLTDISGLAAMTDLTSLVVDRNNLISLNGVQSLTNLSVLDASYNGILTDISQVSDLHNLQDLRFEGCHSLSDVTPVESLTNLKILLLDYCYKLSDLPNLSGLTKLTNLNLTRDYVYDLSPIAGLTNCTLNVSYNVLNLSDTATAGIISALEGNGCTVTDTPQKQFTVKYSIDKSKGTADKAQDTGLAYGQDITMPTVTPVNSALYVFSHWDKSGSGSAGSGEQTALTVSSFDESNFDGTIYTATYAAVWQKVCADLSDPGISGGTLNKAFKASAFSYKVGMTEAQDTVVFAPIAQNSGSSVWVNGTLITPTNPSKSFSIDYNQTKVVSVKVRYGKSTHVYTFIVHRAKSSYNQLVTLDAYANGSQVLFTAQNDPNTTVSFDAKTNHYYVRVDENTSKVTIKASGDSSKHETVSPKSKTYSLQYGQSKTVTVKAKPQTGKTNTYYVTIIRAKCSNANLKSLKINLASSCLYPSFDKGTLAYTVSIPTNKTSVTLTVAVEGYKAKGVIDNITAGVSTTKGALKITPVPGGSSTVNIVVTAQDGTVKTYVVTVNRP